jgi:hypothetical protein
LVKKPASSERGLERKRRLLVRTVKGRVAQR